MTHLCGLSPCIEWINLLMRCLCRTPLHGSPVRPRETCTNCSITADCRPSPLGGEYVHTQYYIRTCRRIFHENIQQTCYMKNLPLRCITYHEEEEEGGGGGGGGGGGPLCYLPRMCSCGNEIALFFEVVVSSWVEQGPILPAVHCVHPHRVVRASVLQSCQEFC